MKTDDKLIAEFMGFNKNVFEPEFYVLPSPYNSDGPFCSCEFLRFANSWDWLMPVVEKIKQMNYVFQIRRDEATLKENTKGDFVGGVIGVNGKISAVYELVVEFIKWYNQQKNDSPSS